MLSSVIAAAVASPPSFATAHLGKRTTLSPPRSRVAESLVGGANGSSIPADGSVWPTAIYWTYVSVGTPPVQYPVAIDSGSGDLDIGGKGCVGCVTTPPNVAYDHTASSTSKAAFPYKFSNSYQTCDLQDPTAVCTISGGLYTDLASLAGLGPVEVQVGSVEKQTSNFDQFKVIDGVMGFTAPSKKNVFSQLVDAGKSANVWAMCMYDGAISNGTITIGGVDPRLSVNGKVNYVPDSGRGFHSVEVASITLAPAVVKDNAVAMSSVTAAAAAPIPVQKSGILDTGTNVLLLPRSLMTTIEASMCTMVSSAKCKTLWAKTDNCVALTAAEIATFPSMILNLENSVDLHMSSRDYLLQGSPTCSVAGQYALGIRDGGSAGGSGFIIGDTTMRNYYLVFDLAQKKIGWGPVNKATCGNIEK